MTVEISDGVRVDILRGTISDVLNELGAAGNATPPVGKGGRMVVGSAANDGKSGGLFGGRK